jgi:SulP family sulfate permease
LSGLTVALALIPEAVAFALIAGLSPLTGLYAAFVVGLVTSILEGDLE